MTSNPSVSNYSTIANSLVQTTRAQEEQLPLRNAECRSRFFLHPIPTVKVCLFFHGFTAAPFQFEPLGQTFHQAGYNVLVPLLPGHGRAGKWNQQTPPPLPTDVQVYKQFALDWFKKAQSLGKQVVVGGLSAGGAMAAWLALEQAAQIDRTLLFAPYLSSRLKMMDLLVNAMNSYMEWQTKVPDTQIIGYKGFMVPALRAFLRLGDEVLDRAKNSPAAPIFTISTASDGAVSNADHQALFESILPRQPKAWYYKFDRTLEIPHAMMTKAEGNAWVNILNVMSKAYVQSDLTWSEVEEIAYRMTQGKLFNQAVTDLKLGNRVSPDMPAVLTMIDKRAIAIKRNPNWRS